MLATITRSQIIDAVSEAARLANVPSEHTQRLLDAVADVPYVARAVMQCRSDDESVPDCDCPVTLAGYYSITGWEDDIPLEVCDFYAIFDDITREYVHHGFDIYYVLKIID